MKDGDARKNGFVNDVGVGCWSRRSKWIAKLSKSVNVNLDESWISWTELFLFGLMYKHLDGLDLFFGPCFDLNKSLDDFSAKLWFHIRWKREHEASVQISLTDSKQFVFASLNNLLENIPLLSYSFSVNIIQFSSLLS